jgi:hypothetical protein
MSACQDGEITTTLLAFPSMYPDDFGKWHQFVEALEDMMDRGSSQASAFGSQTPKTQNRTDANPRFHSAPLQKHKHSETETV